MSPRLTVVGGTESAPSGAGAEGASALTAPLHDAGYLDDDLLEGPRQTPRRTPRRRDSEMAMAEALSHLIGRLSARLLARLGGSEPDLRAGS